MVFPKRLLPNRRNSIQWIGLLAAAGLLLLDLLTSLLAEGFWFREVDYAQVFLAQLFSQGGLIFFTSGISISFLLVNLAIARRQAWPRSAEVDRSSLAGGIGLIQLLPLVLLLSLLVSLLLLYHAQVVVNHWHANFSLGNAGPPVPLKVTPEVLWQMMQGWSLQAWQPVLGGGLAIALLLYPQILLSAIALLTSLGFGLVLSQHWTNVLAAFHPTPFAQTDPLFGREISFYIFTLPVWELIEFWLTGLAVLSLLSVSLVYLLSENSLSQGYFPGLTARQQRHLCGLGGFLLLVIAFSYWLDRYELLYSSGFNTVVYGASYTNVKVELPVYASLSLLAFGGAIWLLWQFLFWQSKAARIGSRKSSNGLARSPSPPVSTSHPVSSFFRYGIGLYILIVAIAELALPVAVQRFVVQPNELQLEQPYIQRTIALTRKAFGLEEIDVQTFNPESSLTYADLQKNDLTVKNIRLWDKRPLLETNRQLQRIRLYYEFADADIDRYTLTAIDGSTAQQQVFIAARELDYGAVPTAAQTWVNKHLIYTHGYGFTVSPVNVVGEEGLPDYFIQGIESVTVDPRVRNNIPIGKPRIYYGELTNTHVMTQTRVKELDYPSGSDNVYNTYDGRGGVSVGTFWQRLIFAWHLRDWRMLFTDDFTPQTKLLFRRTIGDRIRAIAPFLRYDSDPYLVVADTGGKQWERGRQRTQETNQLAGSSQAADQSYLYWMIDAYTTSDHYPYSDPAAHDFNYIRNSVKVVVDAYHGSVNFYVADAQDPIIQTWSQIFPGMFQPLSQMPAALQRHIRYPQDLYQVQSDQLMTYHMKDPVVFYNREDLWRAPNEIYGAQQQLVSPYYLIMKLPIGSSEEFILLRPFTPSQRNNLIAWLAARSDGEEYGKMLLYTFPKQELVYGPEQIEARINQDPVISQRISLWNRQGSRANQGNLLVIPIEQSLLYVEPLYLEAEQNQLPTLVRVIIAYGNRIAMAETLEKSLAAIFQPAPADAPIVRPVGEAEDTLGAE